MEFDFEEAIRFLFDATDDMYNELWSKDMRDSYDDYLDYYEVDFPEWPYAYYTEGFNMVNDGIEFSDCP